MEDVTRRARAPLALYLQAPPATAVTTTVPVADGVAAQPTDDPVAQAAHDPYYWEPGGTPTPVNLLTHNVHWLATSVLHGVEYVGEILGDFFGLFNARYEWAAEADRQRQVSDAGWILSMGFTQLIDATSAHMACIMLAPFPLRTGSI